MTTMNKSRNIDECTINGLAASKSKKLPYQKPELVEINLSNDSLGKALSNPSESIPSVAPS